MPASWRPKKRKAVRSLSRYPRSAPGKSRRNRAFPLYQPLQERTIITLGSPLHIDVVEPLAGGNAKPWQFTPSIQQQNLVLMVFGYLNVANLFKDQWQEFTEVKRVVLCIYICVSARHV